jgi:aspartate/methionine/tyrosine aminotransferase
MKGLSRAAHHIEGQPMFKLLARVQEMYKEHKARRDLLVKGLNELPGVRCLRPGGALYVFPNTQGAGMYDETFSRVMLNEVGVALLPGSNFGENGSGFVRLCYVTSRENITEGLDRMKNCLIKKAYA